MTHRVLFDHYLKTQLLSARELRAYQAGLLGELVQHAARECPFYETRLGAVFGKSGSIDLAGWSDVPILAREHIQDMGESMIARTIPAEHGPCYSVSTSGTSGRPVTVQATALADRVRRAINWRTQYWHGFDWSRPYAVAMRANPGVADWPHGERGSGPWGPRWLVPDGPPRWRIHGATPIHLLVEWLKRNHIAYFAALPITIAALADESGAAGSALTKFLSFGMRVKPEQREAVRRTFGAEIVEMYGSDDCGAIAHQCTAGNLHVHSELVHIEIVDGEGKPCGIGQEGRVLVTVLYNTAQPLIRYEIGDIASFGEPCVCGLAHPVIRGIPGRLRHLFRRGDGTRFVAHTVIGLFPQELDVKWFQIAQVGVDRIEVRIVCPSAPAPSDMAHVASRIRESWRWNCEVAVKRLDAIPYGPGVKQIDYVYEAGET